MSTTNSSPFPPDDKAFDLELRALYRAALLDENFQQQVADSLCSLPQEVQQSLSESEQALLQNASLSQESRAKLLGIKPVCQSSPSLAERFAAGLRHWLLPPVLALPATLVMGLLLGLLLPVLLQPAPQEDTLRGHPVPGSAAVVSGNESGESGKQAEQGKITDAVRQQPQQWLVLIAELLQQGKVAQAREELQAFELLYPDYPPPPSP